MSQHSLKAKGDDVLGGKLLHIPESCGVYLMKDASGVVFYVGKAKNLRDRLYGYQSGSDKRRFVAKLHTLLADLEVILTQTEKEALILEDALIKRHRPRFNVKLTDDKRYLCLRLDTRHDYPRLNTVRNFAADGARYFGPYPSAQAMRQTLAVVNRHFGLRTCSDKVLEQRKRPCLQYQIKRCKAPCVFPIDKDAYSKSVALVTSFLAGHQDELSKQLKQQMQEHSDALRFEEAARIRDQLRAVQRTTERQEVADTARIDRDVVGLFRQGSAVEIHIMRIREGRLSDARRISLRGMEIATEDLLADFATRYYLDASQSQSPSETTSQNQSETIYENVHRIPKEVIFSKPMPWSKALAELLNEAKGERVLVHTPMRGSKLRWARLADRNAEQAFRDQSRQTEVQTQAIQRLQSILSLKSAPESLECVDISHFQGSHIVGSCVRMVHGVPDKAGYRHYKIRSVQDQDDFKSIYEVVSRRCRRGLEYGDLPNLLVIDGGKGQLAAARAALNDHGIDGIDLISLAKSRLQITQNNTDAPSYSPERIFVENQPKPVILPSNDNALWMLARARDEAHRFAISHQRNLRRKHATQSQLDKIPGVGPKRRTALLRSLGSVSHIAQASIEEIAAIVGPSVAQKVHAALNRSNQDQPKSENLPAEKEP